MKELPPAPQSPQPTLGRGILRLSRTRLRRVRDFQQQHAHATPPPSLETAARALGYATLRPPAAAQQGCPASDDHLLTARLAQARSRLRRVTSALEAVTDDLRDSLLPPPAAAPPVRGPLGTPAPAPRAPTLSEVLERARSRKPGKAS